MALHSLPPSGIYCITCISSGLVYVGSSRRLGKRLVQHRCLLRKGEHDNPRLQNAWNKHGEINFSFSVLEVVENVDDLSKREQHWIDELGAADPKTGFNTAPVAGSRAGVPQPHGFGERARLLATGLVRSQETRARIAAAKIGVPRPPEFVERHRQMMIGRTLSEDTKAKMSQVRAGRPQRTKRGLTYDDAQEIRRLRRDEKLTQQDLADLYEISRNSVREILAGRTYTAP